MTTKIHKAFAALKSGEQPNINLGLGDGTEPIPGDALRRTIHPEVRIIDQEKGLVDFIASDQSIDSYREVVLAKGWKFNRFEKNAPFVDSHNYSSVERLLGKVVDWKVRKGQLVERVQYSIDDSAHTLAQIAWKLTVNGFLKAVSVGFMPTKWVSKWGDGDGYLKELSRLGYDTDDDIRVIYQEQEQIELSACIIGANGNAVARAFKADALSEEDLENLSRKCEQLENRNRTRSPGNGAAPTRQATELDAFIRELNQIINR